MRSTSAVPKPASRGSEDAYRARWRWDKVGWVSHPNGCFPGQCLLRAYIKDGIPVREEQAGVYETVEPGVPDMNPMGCQKGAAWCHALHAGERVLHPLRRAGERGEGKWERISWDAALTEVADAMLDTVQAEGPDAIMFEPGHGVDAFLMPILRFKSMVGGVFLDANATRNDFNVGMHVTFGKFFVSSVDDYFHSDLTLIWNMNPVYTKIEVYHYIAESRYRGGEIVLIAPDFSPSGVHADYHLPVRPGTDAALGLAMCHVLINEGLYHAGFVKEQTDLPLLVRTDTRRFLRGSDLADGAREDQFYFFDGVSQEVAAAPLATLELGELDPALEGRYRVRLKDGQEVEVTPVFELLKAHVAGYAPEAASAVCGVHPDLIRMIARKAATKKTRLMSGLGAGKHYHGDLMERAMSLVLALTGNWGKKGTGSISWDGGPSSGGALIGAKQRLGFEGTEQVIDAIEMVRDMIKAEDPTMTDEMAVIEMERRATTQGGGMMVPPVFSWYYHGGWRDAWNNRQWGDPAMKRPFDQYFQEALDRGWWQGTERPAKDTPTRVLLQIGGNMLRQFRGGQSVLLEHFWPKLKLAVSIDYRLNTTAAYSDIVLPAAMTYEKWTPGGGSAEIMNYQFSEKVAEPPGEAKGEWEILRLLAAKLEERGKARGLTEYTSAGGAVHSLDGLVDRYTMSGSLVEDKLADELVRDTVALGSIPEGTTLQTMRDKGYVRFTGWGRMPTALSIADAGDLKPDSTMTALQWHVEQKLPFPTLVRRAQFYIDHDWFLEAGEALPVHKEAPLMGGDYPFVITSGHNRWSLHSINITNRLLLETHRGHPFVFMNDGDARARDIADDEEVRVHNDVGSFLVRTRVTPSVRPGQLVIYNGWEPYLFRGWNGQADVEPGMVKWLHLAGGYGHLRWSPVHYQPSQVDRLTRADVSKVEPAKGS
ncbi:MAG: molybdopterin-dependent oxidoreductase [Dehalococcoidia bacterium]|nr:molybdopterin-dependent oxidoreductase [Dehalococcoidia bacterium]